MAVRTPTSHIGTTAPDSRSSMRRSLEDEVQYVKGVGPGGTQLLGKLGIHTAGDLLHHIPRRYEDRTSFRRISDLRVGEFATISGRVVAADNQSTSRRNFAITKVLVDDGTAAAQLVFFQQPFLLKQFQEIQRTGRWIVVYGQAKRGGYGPIELERIEWEELNDDTDGLSTNRIVPIYPATEGIRQERLRKIADAVLGSHLEAVQEPLPPSILLKHKLMDARSALRNVHFPSDFATLRAAQRRLVFEEFFLLQVGLARRRAARSTEEKGYQFLSDTGQLRQDLNSMVPFELTGAQKRAIDDIVADVRTGRPMNRLIQGDVGSGKTMVAVAAMLLAVRSGFQAALMAPTEILAQQHAIVLRQLLEPIGIPVELATGSKNGKARQFAYQNIASGMSSIAVGTHALIQDEVQFHRLGLVVIDEQHRFGVLQRQALHKKGDTPHVLVMTATPIPRTLTMTLYGDLDTSIIDELPPGRKPIKTHWKPSSDAPNVYRAMQKLLDRGRQAYVVCPLVEESEKLQAKAATQLAEHIQSDLLPSYRIGLLHGQMKPDEKDDTMRRFKARELDVLVATTVIEVGIDVANASVMVIEDAERFGLSQLHQLRGRVGRGEHASYCILLADAKSDGARTRMHVMAETNDGFKIAEEDLKLRGPGEFLGTKQSGLPEFYIGDLIRDNDLMDETRRAAFSLVESDPNLIKPEHQRLQKALERTKLGYELIHVS